MLVIHFIALITMVGFLLCIRHIEGISAFLKKKWIIVVFSAAFILRCIFAYLYKGFTSDTACFAGWANLAYENGLSEFYSSGTFTDYPPGFIYVLWVIGAIFSLFKIPYLSGACLLLLKLPAILCDMAIGFLVYRITKKAMDDGRAVLFSALYLFNPAIFLNSAIWGQVDAVFTLCVVLMCLFLTEEKLVPAYIAFGAGVLLKPQTLVFTPVLIYGIIEHVFLNRFSIRYFFHNLFAGLCVIFCMLLFCMPFELGTVIAQYTSTLSSYPYIAVNAFNLWGFFGLNWVSQEKRLLFLTFEQWGPIIIVLIVLLSAYFFFKNRRNPSRYFTSAGVLIISMFLFSIRMHERYLFPALILLLFAYVKRPAQEIFLCFTGFSVLHFYNTAYILFFYSPQTYNRKAPLFLVISALMVLCGLLFYRTLYRYDVLRTRVKGGGFAFSPISLPKRREKTDEPKPPKYMPIPSEKKLPFTWADFVIPLVITAIYAAFALYDLGDTRAPQSEYLMEQGDSIILYSGEDKLPSRLYWYNGCYEKRAFSLEIKENTNDEWHTVEDLEQFSMSSVFRWDSTALPNNSRYIKITCLSDKASIMELTLVDADGSAFMPFNAPDYHELFDEGDLFPQSPSFRNGTYFDEIYHARTAYEFVNGLPTYETTHPPLGKAIMSIGISLFGMTPFGWRIMGTILGILMLPLIYLIARGITKERPLAGLACLLFAVDFMHFAQTRIATIDVFVTFFILLMYLFMYRYRRMSFYDTSLIKTLLPLGACGISMGLGIACKWTGIYAGAGLAVLFFATLYRRYREYRYAKNEPDGISNGITHKRIIRSFVPNTRKTILFCIVFFVLVPVVIYTLSYIPFVSSHTGLFSKMWNNQVSMLSYHSNLEATHAYASSWYEWPTMIRPIFYYSGIISANTRQGISAFGNPLVWWVGIPAFFYIAYYALFKKDRTAAALCIGYLAQYLPWCLVPRLTFIYHYFPSVPFVILMIVYAAKQRKDRMNEGSYRMAFGLYAAASVWLFLMFYPVLSGQTVSISYVDKLLRWLDSWVLIYG